MRPVPLYRVPLAVRLIASLVALLIVGLAVAMAGPARVASPNVAEAPGMTLVAYSDCPAGQSCLWSGENGAGTRLNLAFSNYDPVGTCHDIPFHPIGGWHSAKGGYGSGYALLLYSGSAGGCTGVVMATLEAGQTWSSAFSRPYSVKIL